MKGLGQMLTILQARETARQLLEAIPEEKLSHVIGLLRDAQDDDAWADTPLTPDEELALAEGRANVERGDYLTLDEFRKQVAEL